MDIGHLFQGHALNAVDAKGRVSVPAGFRSLIEKRALRNALDPDNTLMIGEHSSGHCLTALDAVASAEFDQQLRDGVADLPAAERLSALEEARVDAFGSLEAVKFDGAGRMAIKRAYKLMYRSNLNLGQAILEISKQEPTFELRRLIGFLQATQRGISGIARVDAGLEAEE